MNLNNPKVWGLHLTHLTKMELFLIVSAVIETIFRNCNNELLLQEGSYSFLIRSRGLCVLKLSLRKEAVIETFFFGALGPIVQLFICETDFVGYVPAVFAYPNGVSGRTHRFWK